MDRLCLNPWTYSSALKTVASNFSYDQGVICSHCIAEDSWDPCLLLTFCGCMAGSSLQSHSRPFAPSVGHYRSASFGDSSAEGTPTKSDTRSLDSELFRQFNHSCRPPISVLGSLWLLLHVNSLSLLNDVIRYSLFTRHQDTLILEVILFLLGSLLDTRIMLPAEIYLAYSWRFPLLIKALRS